VSEPDERSRPTGFAAVRFPGARFAGIALTLLLGLVVGLVGTITHRTAPPWGLLAAVAATLSAAVLARATAEGAGLAAYAAGLLLVIQAANGYRPGGDVLIPADALGYAWLVLPLLMCAVVTFLPRRWWDRRDAGMPT
jgi:hypothetical protein